MRFARVLLLASALIAGIWVANRYWQNRPSREVRNAFCSSLSPSTSESDIAYYLREAKLASRTKQDANLIGSLDEFFEVASDDAQRRQTELNRTLEGLRYPMDCLQYDLKSAAHTYCVENENRKIKEERESDAVDDAQIKLDDAKINELRPKLKAQQDKYCSGPSVFNAKPQGKR